VTAYCVSWRDIPTLAEIDFKTITHLICFTTSSLYAHASNLGGFIVRGIDRQASA